MKRKTFFLHFCMTVSLLAAQEFPEIERLARLDGLTFRRNRYGAEDTPNTVFADEPGLRVTVADGFGTERIVFFRENGDESGFEQSDGFYTGRRLNFPSQHYFLGGWHIIGGSMSLWVKSRDGRTHDFAGSNGSPEQPTSGYGGPCFILRDRDGINYTVFYVNGEGVPGALNTAFPGRRYGGRHLPALLESFDPEKYRESLGRAEELGLREEFLEGKVLVWGRTHYAGFRSFMALSEKLSAPGMFSEQVFHYDQDGIVYIMQCTDADDPVDQQEVYLGIFDGDGRGLAELYLAPWSEIMRTPGLAGVSNGIYSGFGGNVYFFFSGPEYTELFRIRRTWGEPNFYAMAVNGYTEDNYGLYVKRVLSGMNARDLALLRNHIFAIEGMRFNRPEYREYFEKQLWYSPSDIRQEDIRLFGIRQALLELILQEEQQRRGAAPEQ